MMSIGLQASVSGCRSAAFPRARRSHGREAWAMLRCSGNGAVSLRRRKDRTISLNPIIPHDDLGNCAKVKRKANPDRGAFRLEHAKEVRPS